MKKQYIKLLATVLITAMALTSCDLTREPDNTIPRERSLESLSDAKKWDTGFMVLLRNRVGGVYYVLQDYQADYLNASAEYGNRGGSWYGWNALNSGDYDVKDIWSNYYIALKNINEFLELSETIELANAEETAIMDTYKGDAHLLRAYYYSELAIRYGTKYNESSAATDLCVPLVLKYDFTELPPRATNAEIYGQIAKDIQAAKSLLKGRENKPMSRVLTEDAAYALEARVALIKNDWSTALASAEKLIKSGTYPLVEATAESFTKMWRADDSSEDIVQLYVKKTDEEPLTVGYYGYSSTLKAHNPDYYPTQGVMDLYAENDLRKKVYFEKVLTKVGAYKMDDIYVISKYKGNPEFNTTDDPRYIIRPKLFRMGEIYMIAAEAAFMSGNTTAAANYLNTFKASRGLAAVPSGDGLMQEIKNERTRELAFEGQRFWDLRRWDEPMQRMSPQSSTSPVSDENSDPIGTAFLTHSSPLDFSVPNTHHKWIWPIPYNELTTNINIKDQQNPGW